jgi:hypothetical protein
VEVPTSHTRIDFRHDWVPSDQYPFDLETAMFGGGVAVGDFDGDGRSDMYLSRPYGGNRLYRNLGDFKFQDVTDSAGLGDDPSWGGGVTFADVNNDGSLDIYACIHAGPNRLYINQRDGTFLEQASRYGLDFRGASVMMAFADYDRDGDLDGYLLTNRLPPPKSLAMGRAERVNGQWIVPEEFREYKDVLEHPDGSPVVVDAGQYDHLFQNAGTDSTGQMRFVEVSRDAGISGNDHGLAATWWDYDDDGFPDLYVANDFTDPDHLYHNNKDGTFTDVAATALPHTPWFSMGVDVADINNDGRFDLLATDMAGTTHYKQKVGMGEMSSRVWFLDQPVPRQYMRNALFVNSGTSRFWEAAYLTGLANTDWTWSVRWEDLDNDGWVDLFVTNGMTRDWQNGDLKQRVERLGGKESPAGRAFWLEQPPKAEPNLAFRNERDWRFEEVGRAWGLDHVGVSFGAALADLDNDGDLDIVVNNFQEPASIYRNQSTSGNRIVVHLRGTSSNRFGVGAKIEVATAAGKQVRYATLSRGFMSCAGSAWHFGLGDSPVVESLIVNWPSGVAQEFRNLPANQAIVITEAKTSDISRSSRKPLPFFREASVLATVRHLETPYDDFAEQPLLPYKLSQLGPGMAWADIDNDGDDDGYIGGAAGQAGSLVMNRDGQFVVSPQSTTPDGVFAMDHAAEDMGAVFFDVDSDGDQDLYCVSGGVEQSPGHASLRDRLYLNDGHGKFSQAPEDALPDDRDSGGVVAAADYDRDGDLDLFVGGRVIPGQYPLPAVSRLLRNNSTQGNAKLVDVTMEVAAALHQSGLVTGAVWSDANQDGWVDLLVSHEWGPVKLFLNKEGQFTDVTGAAGLANRHGWWKGISAGDLDHDTDIDYVVTNMGWNTKYHASAEHPQLLYLGDFDGNGRPQLIEAEYEDSILYPMRGKSCSSHAIPSLAQRFTTFHEFATAPLSDIYTQPCLDRAQRWRIDTLESGVLINNGKAEFTFQPLPRWAQIAPSFGSALTDVDGDGHVDILLVQNFYSPQLETGRMDGGMGMLLLGDGSGNFTPLPADRSGIVIPADARSIALTDTNLDGRLDLVVGVNNGPPLVLERESTHP